VQPVLSEKAATKVCVVPSQGMPVRLYGNGLVKGGRNVCETGGTAVLSVIERVPEGGGLLNSRFPEIEKVLVTPSQTDTFEVRATMEQFKTILQLVWPVPPVCWKVIIPG
jgi:hypothetical protein